LAGALGDHPSDLIEGGVDLEQVDANDGEKIVSNIFGPNQDQVAQTLGGNLGGQAGGLIKQLLPILAPIVLSYLTKRLLGQRQGSGDQDPLGSILSGGAGGSSNPLNDMLNSMLGGGTAGGASRQSSGGQFSTCWVACSEPDAADPAGSEESPAPRVVLVRAPLVDLTKPVTSNP
jgi:hypothetical protein